MFLASRSITVAILGLSAALLWSAQSYACGGLPSVHKAYRAKPQHNGQTIEVTATAHETATIKLDLPKSLCAQHGYDFDVQPTASSPRVTEFLDEYYDDIEFPARHFLFAVRTTGESTVAVKCADGHDVYAVTVVARIAPRRRCL